MITTISIPSADGTEIAIYARKGKRRVGSYKLKIGLRINDREEIVGSYIRSYAQNLKIPKTLIDEAQRQLKNLAAKRKTTLIHKVLFTGPEEFEKLGKHFLAQGYENGDFRSVQTFTKKFKYEESEK